MKTRWSMLLQLHGPEQEAAWRWFADCYGPLVSRYFSRRLSPQRFGRDKVEEFWGWAYERRVVHGADPARSFRRFLFGVLHNFVRENVRELRHQMPSLPPDCIDPRSLANDFDDVDHALWCWFLLAEALGRLRRRNPNHARALEFFYGLEQADGTEAEQLSASRIGAVLDYGHPLHLISDARKKFKEEVCRVLSDTVSSESDWREEIDLFVEHIAKHKKGLYDEEA